MLIIVDSDKELRDTHANMFYYMGVLAAAYAPEELSLPTTARASAILALTPGDEGQDAEGLSMLTAGELYAVSDGECCGFSMTLPRESYAPGILKAIAEHQRSIGKEPLGTYKLFGIDASVFRGEARFNGIPLGLTRTETMILRYLIHSYPWHASAEEILAHSFRASRTPEETSVRTHISIINRKFREVSGVALTAPCAEGYVIDGERINMLRCAKRDMSSAMT